VYFDHVLLLLFCTGLCASTFLCLNVCVLWIPSRGSVLGCRNPVHFDDVVLQFVCAGPVSFYFSLH